MHSEKYFLTNAKEANRLDDDTDETDEERKVLEQFSVDAYGTVERGRLQYLRHKQGKLRADPLCCSRSSISSRPSSSSSSIVVVVVVVVVVVAAAASTEIKT
ncbi:hypothetical protein ElyMa_005602500 [Elysia marginata]|uniref:CTNNB1 binding N-teminal domain-containing protein n=1 Tax=Elysia marginata TaxID=1093978 RepID=A0AAV4F4C8_9GAST|nr:hypothetical protein ElyMa_005602500 [Elysia marginata]